MGGRECETHRSYLTAIEFVFKLPRQNVHFRSVCIRCPCNVFSTGSKRRGKLQRNGSEVQAATFKGYTSSTLLYSAKTHLMIKY